jgi:hypothetical protein
MSHGYVCLLILCLLGQLHSGYALLAASVKTECHKKCCHGKDTCCKRGKQTVGITAAAPCSQDPAKPVATAPFVSHALDNRTHYLTVESALDPQLQTGSHSRPTEFALYAKPPPLA